MGPGVRRECGFFGTRRITEISFGEVVVGDPHTHLYPRNYCYGTKLLKIPDARENSLLGAKNSLRGVTKFPARDAGNCQRNASFHYVGVGSFGAHAKIPCRQGISRHCPHGSARGWRHPCLWIGSIQRTSSGFSTGSMSRLTTTASLSLRTRTHSRVSSEDALISWCGT